MWYFWGLVNSNDSEFLCPIYNIVILMQKGRNFPRSRTRTRTRTSGKGHSDTDSQHFPYLGQVKLIYHGNVLFFHGFPILWMQRVLFTYTACVRWKFSLDDGHVQWTQAKPVIYLHMLYKVYSTNLIF